jgi:hypothetical protein
MKSNLHFVQRPLTEARKTLIWDVLNATDAILGEIKWHAPWRRYCFFPNGMLCADACCLAELQTFLVQQMTDRLIHDPLSGVNV